MAITKDNPVGLRGIAFVEFAHPDPLELHRLWASFGFSLINTHRRLAVHHYTQGDIHLLVNEEADTHADHFQRDHGPCISALGLYVDDPRKSYEAALARGAKAYVPPKGSRTTLDKPAILGIGDSLIYFVDDRWLESEFAPAAHPRLVKSCGFTRIDHLTNNVHKGTLTQWADYYKNIFGFTEVRHFDIKGQSTGLYSYALRSPDGSFCIPINEGTDTKSQIEEYLRDYKGPGVQHLAFLSNNLLDSLDAMAGRITMLDMDADYYNTVFQRVPNVKEDKARIQKHQVLVDGDKDGYLLQIFTRNLLGPIFIELIQRHNHLSFGEGNFGALFRSIERDQQRRGVL